MHLIYGNGFDTTTPHEPQEGGVTFGARAVGPMGLLEELELRTGCFGAGLAGARAAANGERQQRFYIMQMRSPRPLRSTESLFIRKA